MIRTLQIKIESGENTCAIQKGLFCSFLMKSMNGAWSCGLFGSELFDEKGGLTGWLQRCNQCKEAEKRMVLK